jgi:hypothetical protein
VGECETEKVGKGKKAGKLGENAEVRRLIEFGGGKAASGLSEL